MVSYRRVKKSIKKVVRKTANAAGKRYYSKTDGLRVGNIIKDVALLKKMVNAEKKHYGPYAVVDGVLTVGQISQDSSGALAVDMTPAIVQGATRSTRNGNSIKMHSAHFVIQLTGQINQSNKTKCIIEFWKVKNDVGLSTATALSQLFNHDPFISDGTALSVFDYQSGRDPDYFNDWVKIGSKLVVFNPDSVSGQTMIQTVNMGVKFRNFHMRWNDSGLLTDGQIFMTIRCDTGNSSTVASTLATKVSQTGASTGINIRYGYDYYFYDN